jgi:hypothetical protein
VGQPKTPHRVKLIVSAFAPADTLLSEAREALVAEWGPIDFESGLLAFDHTRYYEAEYGTGLVRRIWAFEELVAPEALAAIKLRTNELEKGWTAEGRRKVNLDSGYVSLSKLVLATTKNYDHRIYLGKGIYAEVTLHYRNGGFRPWPWTYPDYASAQYCELSAQIRRLYVSQLQQEVE